MKASKWLRAVFVVSLAIALHALAGGSAQAAPAGSQPVTLTGSTSQGYSVSFKIAPSGRMALMGGITLDEKCTSGANIALPDGFSRVPIKLSGRLHFTFVMPPTPGPDGTSITGRDTLTAKLNPGHSKLTGTWRLRVGVSLPRGPQVQCDSGPVHFTATG